MSYNPSTIDKGTDVVTFLKEQHAAIKEMFAEVARTSGTERDEAFTRLRRTLAVHETAEEEVVHPRAREELDSGEQVVKARLAEEKEAKQQLAELESMDLGSAEFDAGLEKLRAAVTAHAEAEEQEEFRGLLAELDPEQLTMMRRAAELAERSAPTHPHPHIEGSLANRLVGPFAAMLDHARDAIHGKR